jgi:glycerophosphoryl diester phosphodiesterase
MKQPYFLLVFLFFLACEPESFDIHNLNDDKIIVLGHAGMGSGITYPTNTMESIHACLEKGADGSEMDVQLTKDGVLVAFHDKDLSENTNLSGMINSLNWDEIKGAYYTNIPFLKFKVISLDELFSSIPNVRDLYFSFDIKLYEGEEDFTGYKQRFIQALKQLSEKYDLRPKLFIESVNESFLKELKEEDPRFNLLIYPSSFEVGMEIAKKLDLAGITISTDHINAQQINEAHNDSLYVAIWSVNSRSKNKEAIRKNPDIIQTDRLENLIDLLK